MEKSEKTSLYELFFTTAQNNSTQPAIYYKEGQNYTSITYSHLLEEVDFMAAKFVSKGAKPKSKIAIILNNNYSWPVAFFAILKINAIAVPINPSLQETELQTILSHSETELIVTSLDLVNQLKNKIANLQIPMFILEENKKNHLEAIPSLTESNFTENDLAAIIYTSGTTDQPKAAMLSHKNLIANVQSLTELKLISNKDCILAILPFFHSYPLMVSLILPLLSGAKISLPLYLETQEIAECMRQTNTTVFLGVPRIYKMIIQRIDNQINQLFIINKLILNSLLNIFVWLRKLTGINLARIFLYNLHEYFGSKLRFMISGGASLGNKTAYQLYRWGFTILEGYGLTEASPVVSFNTPKKWRLASVGKPIPGVTVKIESYSTNSIGEIIVYGDNVFQGYYKNPKLNEEIFTKDHGLKTGDLGKLDKRGFLYITGRQKEILVLDNGKKIHLESLENYYTKSPCIEEIAILLHKDHSANEEFLCAVIYPNYNYLRQQGIIQIKERIRWEIEQLSQKLPHYQRIRKYSITNNPLPRTELGKLKRYVIENQHIEWQSQSKPEDSSQHLLTKSDPLLNNPLCLKAYEYLCKKLGKEIDLDANLELDLGLDSLEQIGLFIEFQQLTGIKLENEKILYIFTVRDALSLLANLSEETKGNNSFLDTTKLWQKQINTPPSEKLIKLINQTPGLTLKIINLIFTFIFRTIGLIFFRVKIYGKNNIPQQGPFIICANHTSFLDAPLLILSLPLPTLIKTYFLGLKQYVNHPCLSWAKKIFRLIPITINVEVQDSLQACAYVLKKGKILCLFPEGIRSIDGELKDFKKGLGILVKELNVPVLPVIIDGAYQCWPAYCKFPKTGKINIYWGNLIYPEEVIPSNYSEDIDIYEKIVHNIRIRFLALKSNFLNQKR